MGNGTNKEGHGHTIPPLLLVPEPLLEDFHHFKFKLCGVVFTVVLSLLWKVYTYLQNSVFKFSHVQWFVLKTFCPIFLRKYLVNALISNKLVIFAPG